ncbi:uracil phosphoribosyltransferase-domain-containing protein [Camillea tinctor]|nr:uracil phosphoribosyltransferase-domain-containing protein [Camillea tinctor]
MLAEADQPIIVVGEEMNRSRTMDGALLKALDRKTLRHPRQVLLPNTASPRLDKTKLPVVGLSDGDLIDLLISRRAHLHVIHATGKNAAKLLMTPTRDAECAGPDLIKAHRHIGRYLATEYIAELVGVEDYPINHVQGHKTSGYRFCDEQKILIVALMRGGEPMANGVFKVLKRARFLQ